MFNPKYKRLPYVKLIPQLISKDFGFKFGEPDSNGLKFDERYHKYVQNKTLIINMIQYDNSFEINVFKHGKTYKYTLNVRRQKWWPHINVSPPERYHFSRVNDMYKHMHDLLKIEGLLTTNEIMIKDIIT